MSDDISENASEKVAEPNATPASSWLGRHLWLGQRVAEAREKAFGPSQPGFAWYDLARQICDDVVKIGETGKGSWAVLLLDVTCVELLVRAHLAHAGLLTGNGPLGEGDWESARKIPVVEAAWGKLSALQIATLTALLGPDRDATIAGLSGDERDTFANGLHDLVMRLAEPLEIESNRLGRALFARWSRVLVVGLVLLLAVGFLGRWVSVKLEGPNIALHAAVTVSSQYPGLGLDHSLLVDGDPDTLGFHTMDGGNQWVVIDLGRRVSRLGPFR